MAVDPSHQSIARSLATFLCWAEGNAVLRSVLCGHQEARTVGASEAGATVRSGGQRIRVGWVGIHPCAATHVAEVHARLAVLLADGRNVNRLRIVMVANLCS